MITDALIKFGSTIVAWFFSLFPSWNAPAWFTGLPGAWQGFTDSASGMAAWIPWTVLLAVMAINIGAWLAMFIVKFVMKGVAFFPFIGGSG